jgi:hypothetical protein
LTTLQKGFGEPGESVSFIEGTKMASPSISSRAVFCNAPWNSKKDKGATARVYDDRSRCTRCNGWCNAIICRPYMLCFDHKRECNRST